MLTQARHYFVQAHRLDENNVAVLYRYASTFAEVSMDEATFNNTINVLLLAHPLAPQIPEIGSYGAMAHVGVLIRRRTETATLKP